MDQDEKNDLQEKIQELIYICKTLFSFAVLNFIMLSILYFLLAAYIIFSIK
jgi:hypothetical protein